LTKIQIGVIIRQSKRKAKRLWRENKEMKFPDRRFKNKKKEKVKQLWDRHQRILHRVNLGQGNKEIAQALGVTPQNVSDVRNSKLGRDKLDILRAVADVDNIDAKKRIMEVVPKALDFLEDVIEGKGEGEGASLALRARMADKHLGRAGLGEIKKSASVTHTLTTDDIERIKIRAAEAARQAGVISVNGKELQG
jgi:transcriptional regulator with XRE-family HTH domain